MARQPTKLLRAHVATVEVLTVIAEKSGVSVAGLLDNVVDTLYPETLAELERVRPLQNEADAAIVAALARDGHKTR